MLARILTVHSKNSHSIHIPMIKMQGQWLESYGFPVGTEYAVIARRNELVLKPVTFKDGNYVLVKPDAEDNG